MEANPALANRIFRAVGDKELRFIVNFGFWFGLAQGIPTAVLTVILFRVMFGHFKPDHHFAFEAVAWYWHFVDVVWLLLFVLVYWL